MNRRWVRVATLGVVIVCAVLLTAALVIFDKPSFGGLVGPRFLPIMAVSVIVGGLLTVVGGWKLHPGRRWRKVVLVAWGVIAVVSPGFGYLFIAPWTLLAVLLPAVIGALVTSASTSG